ncbi:MAG: DUF2125 domain-containing protein [Pseudomonadota bacterium]
MRAMLWVIGIVTALWSGYWLVVSSSIENATESWFAERRAEGWQADYASLNTRGFPYRFDTLLTDVALADPGTGVVWSAPEFEIVALAYRPNHIIALFPPEQTLSSPFETLTITNDDMRASARLGGTQLELLESTAEMANVTVTSTNGWEVALDRGLLATRAMGPADDTYDLFFEASNLRPSDALRLGIDPQGRLPDTFQTLKLDARASFDAPWDRFAIERARPQPTRIELNGFDAEWGQLELRAVGAFDVDPDGTPKGEITVKATNWREIISIGEALGTIPPSMVPTITRGLEILASLSGPANTIDVTLNFQNGFLSVGPLPLGPMPKIRLR